MVRSPRGKECQYKFIEFDYRSMFMVLLLYFCWQETVSKAVKTYVFFHHVTQLLYDMVFLNYQLSCVVYMYGDNEQSHEEQKTRLDNNSFSFFIAPCTNNLVAGFKHENRNQF
jgi:hypothetical protein